MDLLRQGLARPDGGARLAAFPTQWRYEVSRLAPELADPATAPAPATLDNAAAKSRFFESRHATVLLLLGDDGGSSPSTTCSGPTKPVGICWRFWRAVWRRTHRAHPDVAQRPRRLGATAPTGAHGRARWTCSN
ncbi:MAG: hypothetical protein R2851_22300 [Caldilineaceae bacterium]